MDERKIDAIRACKVPFRLADVIVILAALVLAIVPIAVSSGKKGSGVEIVWQQSRMVLPLAEDTRRRVGDHLTVHVQDGKVWVTDADCKNRTCVKTGKIGRVGESIVCAQNGIVITVVGESDLADTVGRG